MHRVDEKVADVAEEDELHRVEAEKKLVRKIDWILMPMLLVSLGLQYADKAVLGSAAVFGIIRDLVRRVRV